MNNRQDFLFSVASAYEVGGIELLDNAFVDINESRKIFKKDLKRLKIPFDEKIFITHYTSTKLEVIAAMMQYMPAISDDKKRKEIISRLYEMVKELYENENKEEK